MAIKLPRLTTGWDEQPGLFARWWNDAMTSIEDNINDILAAQATADQAVVDAANAQSSADGAQDTADNANLTANDALALAVTSVQQDQGPAWAASSGTESRVAFSSWPAPVVSNPPTQGEVQAVADELETVTEVLVALIKDLRDNGALTG